MNSILQTQPINFVVAISHLGCGLLVLLLCLPMLKDKVGPNPFYGVRIKKAFESRENWFKLQRFGARQLMLWSGVLLAFGAIALLVPGNNQTFLSVVSLVPYVLLLVPILRIFRYARTL